MHEYTDFVHCRSTEVGFSFFPKLLPSNPPLVDRVIKNPPRSTEQRGHVGNGSVNPATSSQQPLANPWIIGDSFHLPPYRPTVVTHLLLQIKVRPDSPQTQQQKSSEFDDEGSNDRQTHSIIDFDRRTHLSQSHSHPLQQIAMSGEHPSAAPCSSLNNPSKISNSDSLSLLTDNSLLSILQIGHAPKCKSQQ
ncbi:hypothetical protein ACLOJK_010409 [Asimina triloba]